MKNKWFVVSTGFALFSMFFGSGNLVFPITVGQESEGHYLLAALGILSTGVVVPFLGVLGMMPGLLTSCGLRPTTCQKSNKK